jgi:hypothetical protein
MDIMAASSRGDGGLAVARTSAEAIEVVKAQCRDGHGRGNLVQWQIRPIAFDHVVAA